MLSQGEGVVSTPAPSPFFRPWYSIYIYCTRTLTGTITQYELLILLYLINVL